MAHFDKQWDKNPDRMYYIPSFDSNPNVRAASEMDVFTYLTSGRATLGVDMIPKGSKYIVNYYDGADHDSGSNIVDEQHGFAHFSRGISGVKNAIYFLMNYSDYMYKNDYSACLNEVLQACFGEYLRTMDEVRSEYEQRGSFNPTVPNKFSQRFTCAPYLTSTDISRLNSSELDIIRPKSKDVTDALWLNASPEEKLFLIRNNYTEEEKKTVFNCIRYSIDRGRTWLGKKVPEPIELDKEFDNPKPFLKEIEVKDKDGQPKLDESGNIVKRMVPDTSRLFGYLINSRGLSKDMVSWLLDKKYMYSAIQETYIDKSTGAEKPFLKKKWNKEQGKFIYTPTPRHYVVVCGRPSKLKVLSSGLTGDELQAKLKECEEVTYGYKREQWEVWDKIHTEHPEYKNEYVLNPDGSNVLDANGNKVTRQVLMKPFKGEATGSKKTDCWRHENPKSHTLYVFEAPFDAFSLMNLQAERMKAAKELLGIIEPLSYFLENGANYIALGGLSVNGLQDMLSYRTDITKIVICLDRDEPTIDKKTGEMVLGAGQKGTLQLIDWINETNKLREGTNLPQIKAMDISEDPNSLLDVSNFVKVDYNNQPSIKDGKVEHCKDMNEFLRSYRANQGALNRMNMALYQEEGSMQAPTLKYQNMDLKLRSISPNVPQPKPIKQSQINKNGPSGPNMQ